MNNKWVLEEKYVISSVEFEVATDERWGGKGLLALHKRFNEFVILDVENGGHWTFNRHCKKDVSIAK